MPVPLIAVGLTVETQLAGGSPPSPWLPLENVHSISSASMAVDFTEITGKADTVVQRVPNKFSPGTVIITIQANTGVISDMQRWRNAVQFKTQFNVRANCGAAAPTAYWLQFNGAYVSEYTLPQIGSDGLVTYTLSFQLTS